MKRGALLLFFCACASKPPFPAPPPAVANVTPVANVLPEPPLPPSPQPEEPAFQPLADPTCKVHDRGGQLVGVVPLVFEHHPFAKVNGVIEELDLRASASMATVQLSTSEIELTGNVNVGDLHVRPRRSDLVDGWIGIKDGSPTAVKDDALGVEVGLPAGIVAVKKPVFPFACGDLTFVRDSSSDNVPSGQSYFLKKGTTIPLRAKPGGPIVANLSTKDELNATEIEKKGSERRVFIEGFRSWVEVWLDASALETRGGVGYGTGSGRLGTKPRRCPEPVSIDVRGAAGVLRVGRTKPDAVLQIVDDDEREEVRIYLGAKGEDSVDPFVQKRAIAKCSPHGEVRKR